MSHTSSFKVVGRALFYLTGCIGLVFRCLGDDVPNNGEDLTRPPAQFDFRYEFEAKADDVWQDTFTLRVNRPFSLGEGWKIGTRLDIPFVLTNKSSSDNPDGKGTLGFGDVLIQAVLIDEFTNRWAAGLGPRLLVPTSGQDQFGTGKIQLGPIGGVRYSLPEISEGSFVELVVRYARDVGGQPGRSHINRLRWSPTYNVNLPQKWFITFFPSQDVEINFGDNNKWFFPMDFLVGKHLSSRTLISLEASVPLIKQYDAYHFKLQARLAFTF